jgi:EAL domain-containing protein (putative c-di-GMP-specific phosphodiesterase class I)
VKHCKFPPKGVSNISVSFSSFHNLATHSIRSIKIRGDLINDLHFEDNRDHVISLDEACHDPNVEVVAELVEDLLLLDTLRGTGVDYAQGFAVGRSLESVQKFEQGDESGS